VKKSYFYFLILLVFKLDAQISYFLPAIQQQESVKCIPNKIRDTADPRRLVGCSATSSRKLILLIRDSGEPVLTDIDEQDGGGAHIFDAQKDPKDKLSEKRRLIVPKLQVSSLYLVGKKVIKKLK